MEPMHSDDLETFLDHFTDPVERLLVSGAAETVSEAEEMVLNSSLDQVTELLRSGLSDDELARHPLLVLYRTRGSRPREDDLL
jgi:hypothetical protein